MGAAFDHLYKNGITYWPSTILSHENEYLDDKIEFGKLDFIMLHYERFVEQSIPNKSLMAQFQWFMVGYLTQLSRYVLSFDLNYLKKERIRREFHHGLFLEFSDELLGKAQNDGSVDIEEYKHYLIAEGVLVEIGGVLGFNLQKYHPDHISKEFP